MYQRYFFTGIIKSGETYVARYYGEYVGSYLTWIEANNALKKYSRK